jgi:alcohol dehydrogenase (NADP+)
MNTLAFASKSPTSLLTKINIERRVPCEKDIEIEIYYCGVCHSDIHTARGDWGEVEYPCVPGHEIVGVVSRVGSGVTKYNIGDNVGVGCLVNSCRKCSACKQGLEQYCNGDNNPVWTYSSKDTADGSDTKGGYSKYIVVNQEFVLSIPEGLDMAKAAPLLCAGITMYSPLKHWGTDSSKKVGVVGIGGLGHMGIKLAKGMGASVTAITTSPKKSEKALGYGADQVLVSTNKTYLQQNANSLDLIIDTAPGKHEIDKYISLLRLDGSLVLVGPIATNLDFPASDILTNRRSISGSGIGGIKETQEMLNFCAEKNIFSEVEIISIDKINEAWDKMVAKSSSHRYVIDIKNSLK